MHALTCINICSSPSAIIAPPPCANMLIQAKEALWRHGVHDVYAATACLIGVAHAGYRLMQSNRDKRNNSTPKMLLS